LNEQTNDDNEKKQKIKIWQRQMAGKKIGDGDT
jgi:hypothetical protein